MGRAPGKVTARDQLVKTLRENPAGLSKSELHRRLACNRGTFRKLIASMLDVGQITIEQIDVPGQGLTAIVKLKDGSGA